MKNIILIIFVGLLMCSGCVPIIRNGQWITAKEENLKDGYTILSAMNYSCTQEGWTTELLRNDDEFIVLKCNSPDIAIQYYDKINQRWKIEVQER